jgi:hypothetical protein
VNKKIADGSMAVFYKKVPSYFTKEINDSDYIVALYNNSEVRLHYYHTNRELKIGSPIKISGQISKGASIIYVPEFEAVEQKAPDGQNTYVLTNMSAEKGNVDVFKMITPLSRTNEHTDTILATHKDGFYTELQYADKTKISFLYNKFIARGGLVLYVPVPPRERYAVPSRKLPLQKAPVPRRRNFY